MMVRAVGGHDCRVWRRTKEPQSTLTEIRETVWLLNQRNEAHDEAMNDMRQCYDKATTDDGSERKFIVRANGEVEENESKTEI